MRPRRGLKRSGLDTDSPTVNLIAFPPEHLRVNSSLPFDLVDAVGKLLMPKGSVIRDAAQLLALRGQTLMIDEDASEVWGRGGARQTTLSHDVAELLMHLSVVLRDGSHLEAGWVGRVEILAGRVQQLAQRDADGALYLLVQRSTHEVEHYSTHHALLCALVVELVGIQLRWPPKALQSLRLAALTMNLSMTGLQNALARRQGAPTDEHRQQIASHARRSAELLRAAGVVDPLWLDIVEHHHDDEAQPAPPLESLSPRQRLTRMLRRIDVFTAKISPRATRAGLPAPLAARDACLGADGRPDEIGAATIKTLGIYPPGSYVRLASGELAVVLRRGELANQPVVASLVGRGGQTLGEPLLRHTADPRHEIKGTARVGDVRARLNHEWLLALT